MEGRTLIKSFETIQTLQIQTADLLRVSVIRGRRNAIRARTSGPAGGTGGRTLHGTIEEYLVPGYRSFLHDTTCTRVPILAGVTSRTG